jgi:hypothetical protein
MKLPRVGRSLGGLELNPDRASKTNKRRLIADVRSQRHASMKDAESGLVSDSKGQ